jgi:uncharacterized protein (DUF2235 family)
MPKNIVLLSDGTGNSAGKISRTNVWRIYQALDLSRPDQQIAFYDDGVGTSSFKPLALIGGAFGYGLKANVLDLYTFLCRNYKDGDRIFCFGFSRGAFTARSLTGLIACEGLVSDPTESGLLRRAKTAFREYRRKRYPADIPFDKVGRVIRDLFVGDRHYKNRSASHPRPQVAFLGVWDTVAAYGLPIDELTRALNWVWRLYPKDREPLPQVERLRHAVALDDERNTFHPMLFNEEHEPGGNELTKNISEERVSQVWFTGMHSNVGGGYPDDALSLVPLTWMMKEAEACGLVLKEKESHDIYSAADPIGKLYDSRRGLGGFYRYLPRKIAVLTNDTVDKDSPVIVPRPKIHKSVFHRIAKGVDRYAPIGLPARYSVVQQDGAIVDSATVLEHPTQAESRVNLEERIWDLVWWKRVAYFSSILVAALLVTFPLYRHQTVACEGPFCSISPVIGWIGDILPGFLDPWFAAYKSHPEWFSGLLVSYVVLLMIGNRIQGKIFDGMRGLWGERIQNPGNAIPVAERPTNLLFRIRTSRLYRWVFLQLRLHILPALFGLIALVAITGTASRLLFKVISSAGGVCTQTAASAGDIFPTNSLCWAAGGDELEAGKNYKITLTIDDPAEYRDADIQTGLGGFGREKMPWIHPAALFFRRNLGEAWFKPIARIGRFGSDEYVLNPADGSSADDTTREFTAVITARRKGRLYLFVNDAVLPIPFDWWQPFYANNHGKLRVKVEHAGPPAQ